VTKHHHRIYSGLKGNTDNDRLLTKARSRLQEGGDNIIMSRRRRGIITITSFRFQEGGDNNINMSRGEASLQHINTSRRERRSHQHIHVSKERHHNKHIMSRRRGITTNTSCLEGGTSPKTHQHVSKREAITRCLD